MSAPPVSAQRAEVGMSATVGADRKRSQWGCGRKIGLPGGSSCIHTKTGSERSSCTSSSANGSRRPSANWDAAAVQRPCSAAFIEGKVGVQLHGGDRLRLIGIRVLAADPEISNQTAAEILAPWCRGVRNRRRERRPLGNAGRSLPPAASRLDNLPSQRDL